MISDFWVEGSSVACLTIQFLHANRSFPVKTINFERNELCNNLKFAYVVGLNSQWFNDVHNVENRC